MPINKETIISVFTEKLTLEQWLKTINKALDEAVLTGVEIAKKGNATLSFKFTFEDGTYLETNDLVLQQGESVNGAYIQNGHLYLTLTNDQTLDAGNVKPVSSFSIDGSQHLIVNYQDGTSQDLGAIFNGNVNISGTLNATKVTGDEIVETMTGYSASMLTPSGFELEKVYVGAVKTGNKITLVFAFNITKTSDDADIYANYVDVVLPQSVLAKLYPVAISGGQYLDNKAIALFTSEYGYIQTNMYITKQPNGVRLGGTNNRSAMTLNEKYYCRYEATFLLSDDLVAQVPFMKNELIGGSIGTALSAVGTGLQTNDVLQTISLIITIIGALISFIIVPLLTWYKNAKKDGKIDKEEIDEAIDIVVDGSEKIKGKVEEKKEGK